MEKNEGFLVKIPRALLFPYAILKETSINDSF